MHWSLCIHRYGKPGLHSRHSTGEPYDVQLYNPIEALRNMDDKTVMKETIQELQEDIKQLKAELAEREAALPAHSVRPYQLMAIEDLEEEISMKEEVLKALS